MEYVYIGIFGTILSWVFEKILSPVFEFISNLLSKVLSWLFNSILKPLLIEVLWPLIEDTLDLLVETLAEILYSLYAGLLKMIDTMNSAFNYFVGLSDVTYNNQKMPLLDAMFQIDGLRTGFLLISCMGLSIAGLLAVIAVIQSTLDLDFENKRPVSRVLSACLKSFFQLLTVEFVVVFMVKLSGLILKGVDQAVGMVSGSGESTTLARMIFVVSSMNAARDKKWNLNGDNAAQVGITDKIRAPFYSVSDPKNLSYADIDKVGESFYFSKFDYLIGFALAIFLLIVMACCMVVFVQRIFDMMVLYLVSPLFVGMIPLDDGERFGKWREMFIGKCFSGFGMVMTMKLYIMLCPSIMSSSLEFSNSTELNYLTKMVFLLGGAWAVLKSGNMITSLISQGVGYSEQQTSGAVMTMGLTGMTMAGGMAFRGMQLAGGAVGKAAGKTAGRSKQAFSDSKYRPSGGSETTAGKIPGIAENVGGTGGTSGGSGGTGGTSVGTGGTGRTSGGTSGGTGGTSIGIGGTSIGTGETSIGTGGRSSETGGSSTGTSGSSIGTSGPSVGSGGPPTGTNAASIAPGGVSGEANEINSASDGTSESSETNENKDTNWNINHRFRVLGVDLHSKKIPGIKLGYDAKGTYLKQLGPIGYKGCRDSQGNYHMTNLFGNSIRREQDATGKYSFTNFMGLVKREKQEDGKYHISSVLFGAVQTSRVLEGEELNYSAVRVLGINVHRRDDVIRKNRKNRKNGPEDK